MILRPPRTTRTDTHLPNTTLVRSPIRRAPWPHRRKGRLDKGEGAVLPTILLAHRAETGFASQCYEYRNSGFRLCAGSRSGHGPGARPCASSRYFGPGVSADKYASRHFQHLSRRVPHCPARSEERRVGKECVSTFRSGGAPCHQKKKKKTQH